jgi:hypothetical protein
MARKNYTAKMPWGDKLIVSADLVEASAPICTVTEDEDGEESLDSTPYQTADARHRELDAVMLAVEYCGREWYAQPGDTRETAEILAEIRQGVKIA